MSKGSSSECSLELAPGPIDDSLVLLQRGDIARGFGEPGEAGCNKLNLGLEARGVVVLESQS